MRKNKGNKGKIVVKWKNTKWFVWDCPRNPCKVRIAFIAQRMTEVASDAHMAKHLKEDRLAKERELLYARIAGKTGA